MWPGGAGAEPPVAALARAAMTRGLDALTANDTMSALRWLERAHRLVPHDPNATLTLASAWLGNDDARAASLFQLVADGHDVRQAWAGLAAARLRMAGPDDAAKPMATLLSNYAFAPDVAGLAAAIGGRPGSPGWCALRPSGRLEIHAATPGKVRVLLDGKVVRGTTLPAHWQRGRTIDIRIGDVPLLGSPIRINAIRRLAGCVEAWKGGIRGWAWHPGDPDTAPAITFSGPSGSFVGALVATDESISVPGTGPLARPRSFRLTRAELPAGLVHVRGQDGNDLPGSPLDPSLDEAAHVATALGLGRVYSAGPPGIVSNTSAMTGNSVLRADGPVPDQPIGADTRKRAVTVVIPVHDGGPVVLDCLDSVLAAGPADVLVVDDGSFDPELIAKLDDLVRRGKITLLRHPRALGFPAAANAGIRATGGTGGASGSDISGGSAAPTGLDGGMQADGGRMLTEGCDVVLLNSDTLVPPGWLDRLRAAAYADRDIGTVTPLSNEASILSYPGPAGTNPRPDQDATNRLDSAAERANGGTIVDIPIGVGFCLYLRRDCLHAVGAFRADLFAQGYGEENDFCLRARRLGWRHVALTGLFVGHLGGGSFGGSGAHLRARNRQIIEEIHPGYNALIEGYLMRDPLAEPRRRIDHVRWREAGRERRRSAILIAHNDGGGVEQRLIEAVKAHAQDGRRPIVLRPAQTAGGEPAIAVHDGATNELPNLIYAIPRELPALLGLLRETNPEIIEAHHFASYHSAIYDLTTRLGVPYDVHVHDYAWFCPRVSLVGAHDRYCGEPDVSGCEACVADNGHFLQESIAVAALRQRSMAFLSAARQVVVPSDDTGLRMRRHFDGLTTLTVPHEDDHVVPTGDAATPRRALSSSSKPKRRARASICVVGAIGVHKGYDIVLACARDAIRRSLDLEFIIVGHTIDDARMLATERIFVTGRFDPDEAVRLIAEQNADLGFVASICPETWCLSLGDIWRAGLRAAAFDIGAPAERIRKTGRGILLPLGLSAGAINNALVAAIATAEH